MPGSVDDDTHLLLEKKFQSVQGVSDGFVCHSPWTEQAWDDDQVGEIVDAVVEADGELVGEFTWGDEDGVTDAQFAAEVVGLVESPDDGDAINVPTLVPPGVEHGYGLEVQGRLA